MENRTYVLIEIKKRENTILGQQMFSQPLRVCDPYSTIVAQMFCVVNPFEVANPGGFPMDKKDKKNSIRFELGIEFDSADTKQLVFKVFLVLIALASGTGLVEFVGKLPSLFP